MAELTEYTQSIYNGNSQVKPLNKSRERVAAKPFVLTKYDILIMTVTFILCIALIGVNLKVQVETATAETAIKNYEAQTLALSAQTDIIYNQISDQFNYQTIKKAAQENGMKIDGSRVRSVE